MARKEETLEEGPGKLLRERKPPHPRLDTPFYPIARVGSSRAIANMQRRAKRPPELPIESGSVVRGWIMVHRPFMILLVVVGTIVGYLLTTVDRGLPVVWDEFLVGLLSVAFVVGGVDLVHEAWDKEVDAINKPYRPIPSGLVSQRAAWTVGAIEFALGLVLGAYVSLSFIMFLVFMISLTTHYSVHGKFVPLLGQLESTVGSAMVAYCGGVLGGDFTTLIPLCVFIFCFENGRWIMVNLEDMEADLARGKTTVYYLDTSVSNLFALALYVGALGIATAPWFVEGYSMVYRVGSAVLAATLIMLWGLTAINGFVEDAYHRHHRNAARVWIALYQFCLIAEAFV